MRGRCGSWPVVSQPGGLLVATVPAYMWLWSQSDVSLQHRRRYSRGELLDRAAGAGWEPVLSTYFNSALLAPIALARALRRGRGAERPELELTPEWLDRLVVLPMLAEAALIRRGATLPTGSPSVRSGGAPSARGASARRQPAMSSAIRGAAGAG